MEKERLSPKQIEAHLNEYKGNVLEFLLAQKIAVANRIEGKFLASLDSGYFSMLSEYEKKIRELNPKLLKELPRLATKGYESVADQYENLKEVFLVGKQDGSGKGKEWKEADILLKSANSLQGLSLKLCKRGAYVNTKSGGIRSFLTRYFSYSSHCQEYEKEINELVDQGFLQMIHRLYEDAGLDFRGKYDEQWVIAGHSELPGELENQQRKIVHHFYFELAQKLYSVFLKLYNEDGDSFKSSILSLLGHSDSSVDHLYLFHVKSHQWDHSLFLKADDFREVDSFSWREVEPDLSYFYMCFQSFTLQIRLKPMNKFTSASLKVNCSVKFV